LSLPCIYLESKALNGSIERERQEKMLQGAEEAPRNWKAPLPKAEVDTGKPDFGY
jgi:hypothetical protein